MVMATRGFATMLATSASTSSSSVSGAATRLTRPSERASSAAASSGSAEDRLRSLLAANRSVVSELTLPAVLRRIERRMQVTRQRTLPDYAAFLQAHAQETLLLLQDMLAALSAGNLPDDSHEGTLRAANVQSTPAERSRHPGEAGVPRSLPSAALPRRTACACSIRRFRPRPPG